MDRWTLAGIIFGWALLFGVALLIVEFVTYLTGTPYAVPPAPCP